MTSTERPRRPHVDSVADEGGGQQARRAQVEAIVEEFADIHPPNYLDDLRRDWPE